MSTLRTLAHQILGHPRRLRWLLPLVGLCSLQTSVASQPLDDAAQAASCDDTLDAYQLAAGDSAMVELLIDDLVASCGAAHAADLSARQAHHTPPSYDADFALRTSRFALVLVLERSDCGAAIALLGEVVSALGGTLPPEARVTYGRASQAAFACRTAAAQSLFGSVVLYPAAAQQEVSGTVAGWEDASIRFGGSCIGFVSGAPNHAVEVTDPMRLTVEVFAANEIIDLSLIVAGEGQIFCNDDFHHLNPAVSESVQPGIYEVYVAELAPTGVGVDYSVLVSSSPLSLATVGLEPRFGEARLIPRGEAEQLEGSAGGTINARMFGAECVGLVGETPSHRLIVPEHMRVTVQVRSEGGDDLTLIIVGEDVTYCNDDFEGLAPAVSEWMDPGVFDVYVGQNFSTGGGRYQIDFSSADILAAAAGSVPPIFDGVTVSLDEPTAIVTGVAIGEANAYVRFGPGCSGLISDAPSHALHLEVDAEVFIDVEGAHADDPVLVLTGPSGTFCNDDLHGRNPGLGEQLMAGDYDIYVGEFSPTAGGTAYGLRVTLEAPSGGIERDGDPDPVVLSPELPTLLWGRALGTERPEELGLDLACEGAFGRRANHIIQLPGPASLYVGVEGWFGGELVMALNGPDGAVCVETFDELNNPLLEVDLPAGIYELYIGELNPSYLGTPYLGGLEIWPPPVGATGLGQAEPLVGTITASFSGVQFEPVDSGVAAPQRAADALVPGCEGEVTELPHFALDVQTYGRYRLLASSESGSRVIVIPRRGGEGFCGPVDDALIETLPPGGYDVFVATTTGSEIPFVLGVEMVD